MMLRSKCILSIPRIRRHVWVRSMWWSRWWHTVTVCTRAHICPWWWRWHRVRWCHHRWRVALSLSICLSILLVVIGWNLLLLGGSGWVKLPCRSRCLCRGWRHPCALPCAFQLVGGLTLGLLPYWCTRILLHNLLTLWSLVLKPNLYLQERNGILSIYIYISCCIFMQSS